VNFGVRSQNPFVILGLNPDALRGLKDEQIMEFAKAMNKQFQRVHHPDIGGDEEKSQYFNQVFTQLEDVFKNNPSSFKQIKIDFFKISKAKEKAVALEESIREQQEKGGTYLNLFVKYINSSRILLANKAKSDELNVFNISSRFLIIYDSVTSYRLGLAKKSAEMVHKKTGKIDDSLVTIMINADRSIEMWRPKIVGKTLHPSKILFGTMDQKTLEREFGSVTQFFTLISNPELLDGSDINSAIQMLSKGQVSLPSEESVEQFTNRISPKVFSRIFSFLSPEISEGRYLFSFNNEFEPGYFSLEGIIQNIDSYKS
jgi:hypothetical protein